MNPYSLSFAHINQIHPNGVNVSIELQAIKKLLFVKVGMAGNLRDFVLTNFEGKEV